jgi:hypothetical protein
VVEPLQRGVHDAAHVCAVRGVRDDGKRVLADTVGNRPKLRLARATSTTDPPRRATAVAAAAPIPPLAPVMTTTFRS